MYKVVLDQNWIRNFFILMDYPIGSPSKLYEDNKVTIKGVLWDTITHQSRHIDVIITALHKLHLIRKIEIVDTRSNM